MSASPVPVSVVPVSVAPVRVAPLEPSADARPRSRGRRFRLGLVLAFVLLAAALVPAGGASPRLSAVSDLTLIAIAFTAAAACLLRARREQGAWRQAWACLTLACASWGCGMISWSVYELALRVEPPQPSYADVGFLAAVPLLIAGLLLLSGGQSGWAARLRLLLDGAVIGAAVLMLSNVFVLPGVLDGGHSLPVTLVTLAYPVGDVVAVTVAFVALVRARGTVGAQLPTLLLLVAGILVFGVGDSAYAALLSRDAYYSGHPTDLGWAGGLLLVAAAASMPPSPGGQSAARRGAVASGLAPYAPVLVAAAVGAWHRAQHGHLSGLLAWGLLTVLVLVTVRQVLSSLENHRLLRDLEARVAERTETLAERERWFRSVLQNSSDVLLVVDEEGTVGYHTPSVERVLGHPHGELEGRPLAALLAPGTDVDLDRVLRRARVGAPWHGELLVRRADGAACAVDTSIVSLLHDPAVGGHVVTLRDVSERKVLEEELAHQAFHDALTGLANKTLFAQRVEQALPGAGSSAAILFLDLDGFKAVNDSLGHSLGDELLRVVAARLSRCVRDGDTVARFGGDEFAVLLPGVREVGEAADVAQRALAALLVPVPLAGRHVQVEASIGIVLTPAGGRDPEELLRNADLAMYQAKAAGGGYRVFESEMHAAALTRLDLEADLRQALGKGQFRLEYQPTVDLDRGRVTGVEALLRWDHPVRGAVSPADFVPMAEQLGVIVDIGAWVVEEACAQAAGWARRLGPDAPFSVAVNTSGRQLTPELVHTVTAALARSGLPARALVLEVTESLLIDRTDDVLGILHELRALGVRLALDDFGTGYSSLSYLSRIPVDILKLDRSFINGVAEGSREAHLTRAILDLAHLLELDTVAEGVEEAAQAEVLRAMGCARGQGYYWSRPLRPADLEAVLELPAEPGALAPPGRVPLLPAPRPAGDPVLLPA